MEADVLSFTIHNKTTQKGRKVLYPIELTLAQKMIEYKSRTIVFLFVCFASFANAQQVEILGGLKVTSMNEDSTETSLVVRQANGTLAYRDALSLETEGVPQSGIVLSQTSNNIELENAGFTEMGKQSMEYSEKSFGTWTATTITNAPSAREGHSAVWTGTEMLIWGGFEDPAYTTDGGRYNPDTDSWLVLGANSEPTARRYHTVLWTGSFMLVWGGYDGTHLNSGGIYDYSVDKWAGITTTAGPTARSNHSAIWTGTDMIIWGGNDDTNHLNTGGRYNLATQMWFPITMTNAPSARAGHSAIWTGNEMIIWGGGNGTALDDGSKYDPVTDTWTSISSIDAPAPSLLHTAIWTGTEMIIWGGLDYSPNGQLSSGAKYDPSTDSWMAISLVGAPIGRTGNTATWTGTHVLIYGGAASTVPKNKLYNVNYDFWSTIDDANQPSLRYNHSAVWTGTKMIIWGGRTYGGVTDNTGGVLDPFTPQGYGQTSTVEYYLYRKN